MKLNKILLLLSAATLLASCGQNSNPSSSPSLTSSEPAETSSSEAISSSSSSAPFVPKAEDYGVLLGTFISPEGTLKIEVDKATFTPKVGEPQEWVPTAIKEKEYIYHGSMLSLTREVLLTISYGDARRVRLASGPYKFVVVEESDGEEWSETNRFQVITSEFAGAYNAYERWSLDEENYLYFIGAEYDPEIDGYPMKGAYRANDALSSINWAAQAFFAKEGNDYVVAMDFLDLEDNLYFNTAVTVSDTGLRAIGSQSDYFYPDFSILLGKTVDDQGDLYYFDYDEDGLYDYEAYEGYGEVALKHDHRGFYFEFGETEKLVARLTADNFTLQFANEDGWRYLAPEWTFYDLSDDVGRSFESADMSLHVYYDYDWDTYESFLALTVNGEDTPAELKATEDGVAVLLFTYNGVEYEARRFEEHFLHLYHDNGSIDFLFDKSYYADLFEGSFHFFNDDVHQTITFTENGQYAWNSVIGSVVYIEGEASIALADPANGVYFYLINDQLQGLLLADEFYQSYLKTYLGVTKNDSNVALVFNEDGITYRGNEATHLGFSFATDDYGEVHYYFDFQAGLIHYFFMPDGQGAADIYAAVYDADGLEWVESILDRNSYNGLVGDYVYHGEDHGDEHFIFTVGGALSITTLNEQGQAELVDYPVYQFSHGEDGKLIVSIPYAGQAVPFTFDDDADAIIDLAGNTFLNVLYDGIQGIYWTDDHLLVVNGNEVLLDGDTTSYLLKWVEDDILLTLSDIGATVLFDETGAHFTQNDATVDMNKITINPSDWVGTYACEDSESVFTLAIDETTGKLTAYKDGAFFYGAYKVVLVGGQIGLQYKTPFGTATYYNVSGVKTATYEVASIPTPPAPPALD